MKRYQESYNETPKTGLAGQISSAKEELEQNRGVAHAEKKHIENSKVRILTTEVEPDDEENLKYYLEKNDFHIFEFITEDGKRKLKFTENYRETVVNLLHDFYVLQDLNSKNHTNISSPEQKSEDEKPISKQDNSSKNPKQNPRKLNRTVRHQYRFTVEEDKKISEKRARTGKSKGDFGREMLLSGQVKAIPSHANDFQLLGILEALAAQLGKDSGLLWKLVKKSDETGMLSQEDVENLKHLITSLKEAQKEIKRKVKDVWH